MDICLQASVPNQDLNGINAHPPMYTREEERVFVFLFRFVGIFSYFKIGVKSFDTFFTDISRPFFSTLASDDNEMFSVRVADITEVDAYNFRDPQPARQSQQDDTVISVFIEPGTAAKGSTAKR